MAKAKVPTGYQEIQSQLNYWKPEKEGERLEGHYQGIEHHEARDNFPAQDVFTIADGNGELHGLTGATLSRKFERVEVGDAVLVVFNGRQKSKKAGRADFKDFSVFTKGEPKPYKRND